MKPCFVLGPAAIAMASLASCGDGDAQRQERACANVAANLSSPACTPLYEPSYDNVFANTLNPTCAKSGVSCHAPTGRQGGLSFADADEVYHLLIETTQVVKPGDPSCSELVARLTATSGTVRMPPGRSLDANEQCSIVQWIAAGAKR